MATLGAWMKSTVTGQRVLLAAKTALAVGVAWSLAPHLPGVVDDYPYYAPLGVLVSMYPTFMGSVRTAVQSLAGLLLGIVLAAGVLLLGNPNVVSISAAVGLGVLLAGMPRLGAGREYVPVAVLLVLIIGGQDADAFSIGYAVQMGFGVVVGLVINVGIFPPLALDAARAQISRARLTLISQLEDAAAALGEEWPPQHEEWAARRHALDDAIVEVRDAVHNAAESQRANPRAFRRSRHGVVANSYGDLAVLEDITFHVRDLSEVLAGAIWEGPNEFRLEVMLREPLGRCLSATAGLLQSWEDGDDHQESIDRVSTRLRDLTDAIAASHAAAPQGAGVDSLAPGAAAALDVQRILTALTRHLPSDGGGP